MAKDPNWTPTMARRDAEEQQAEHNEAMRAELTDDRDAYLDEYDLRPDPSEL